MSNRSWNHQLHRKAMKEKIESDKFSISKGIFDIRLSSDEAIYEKEFRTVTKGKKYIITTEVIGLEGEKFSALFGVGVQYQKTRVKDIRIRWLNDFSGVKKNVSIVVRATDENLLLFYRINSKTPVRSECHYQILPIKKVKLEELSSDVEESFDDFESFIVQKVRELTIEQENELEKNLVWIFASPRSGTTWLGARLLAERFLMIDEPKIGSHLGFSRLGKNTIEDLTSLENRDDYFFSNQFKDTWKYFLRKLILNRIYAQIRDTRKKIIIKEPNGSIGADIISDSLPNSKIIILLRDGRDIVDSLVDAFSEKGWLAKKGGTTLSVDDRLEFIKEQSNRWKNLVNILLKIQKIHPKGNRILIKYEDLLGETFKVLKNIFQFLNVKLDDNEIKEIVEKHSYKNIPSELKGKGMAIRSASPGKWKRNFNEDEKEMMTNIMNKTLFSLGYK